MFVVKVPGINGFGKTLGCQKAGNFVLDSLKGISGSEKGMFVDTKMLELEEIHLDNSDLKLSNELIYKNALEIFNDKPKTIFLGGDSSISFSLVRAFLENCRKTGKDFCLLVFDSRANCTEFSEKYPTNINWLKNLLEEGFPPENLFLAGIRSYSPSEFAFLKKNKIKFLGMNSFLENLEDSCDILMEFAKNKEIYISIDISVVDPGFAPGTSISEPGGFTSREFLYLIQRINLLKGIKAVDIVEINPDMDFNGLTAKLGAKILAEFL